MCYLIKGLDRTRFRNFMKVLVFDDAKMRARDFSAVASRLERTLASTTYLRKLASSKVNWLQTDPQEVAVQVLDFLKSL